MASSKPFEDRYHSRTLLGEGAGGSVWSVRDRLRGDTTCALKGLTTPSESEEARLRQEFATLARLQHPNLVKVHDFDDDPKTGLPRFSLEQVEGTDLVKAVREEGPAVLVPLAIEALRTLAFLHDFGILHRDLKPANLLVRREPVGGARLVVLDFGFAETRERAEASQVPLGTLPYIAPEIFDGDGASSRSDLYALGALLYEAVHGPPPFAPETADLPAFVRTVRAGERPSRPLPKGYPDGLNAWLDELLDPDAAHRPASASEALARLNAVCGTAHSLETPETRAARLGSGNAPGRDVELEQIHQGIEAEGPPQLVWVAGEAGSGKTRILRSLASRYVGLGWEVLNHLPLHDRDRQDDATTLHMEKAVEHALAELRQKASRRPTLVLLDEMESATPEQVHFLTQFAAESQSERLQLVVAVRQGQIESQGIRDLLRDEALLATTGRVDLRALKSAQLQRVMQRVHPAHDPVPEQVDRLLEITSGNPLLVESLLVDGDWESRTDLDDVTTHPTLENSVANRLAVLSEPATRWIRALAILGPGTPVQLVVRLAELSDDEALAAAREVEARRLAYREGGKWSPSSRLLATHAANSVGTERLQAMSAAAAKIIEDDPHVERVDAGHLAQLWRRAGDTERSLTWALKAAQRDEDRGSLFEAADWMRYGLLGLTRRDPRRRELRLRHAELLEKSGRNLPAARGFATVRRLTEDADERTAILVRQSCCLSLARRPSLGLTLAQRAVEQCADAGIEAKARARFAVGLALNVAGKNEEAVKVLSDPLSTADDPRTDAQTLALLGVAESSLRKLDDARAHLDKALRLAEHAGDPVIEGRILMGSALVEQYAGRRENAARIYDQARAHTVRHRLRAQLIGVLINRSLLQHDLGRYDQALRALAEAEPLSLHLGARIKFLQCRLQRADSLVQTGRPAEAAALMEQILLGSKSGFEPLFVKFACITLAEALLELPSPDEERIQSLLADLIQPGPHFKLSLGALTVELERRCRPSCSEPFEPIWEQYVALRDSQSAAVEPVLAMRALLARAAAFLDSANNEQALEAARSASELAEVHRAPAFAARACILIARSAERVGRTRTAREAWEAARRALDQASALIEDSGMRKDFLARSAFDALRPSTSRPGAEQDRLSALYDMIHALNSETDPDSLLESMLDMALRVVGAERGMVLIREGAEGNFAPRVARNLEQETIADVTEFSSNVVKQAASGEAVLSLDAGEDKRLDAYKSMSLYGIRSVLCVPLRSRGVLIGVVYVDDRTERGLFTENDLKFLEAFANHAGLALENAQIRGELERDNQRLQVAAETRVQFGNMVGRSPAMAKVFDLIERVAETKLPVLIHGESGTGKELVAKAIHYNGPLKKKPLLTENCAAIPESLLESELFGHVKGAFTGADRDRAGLFEQADGGSLFLDEVGDMAAAMQARLLRVLQEGEVRRVGSNRTIDVDVRVIAATHRDLQKEVDAGRFREDLLYRLQVLVIELPALRDRHGDIPLLIDHLLPKIAASRGRPAPPIRSAVMDLLERYTWPGNIRQLESTLQRLALLAGDRPVTPDIVESDTTLRQMLIEGAGQESTLAPKQDEKSRIQAALKAADGNRVRAARMLGMSRATIFRRIKQYEL